MLAVTTSELWANWAQVLVGALSMVVAYVSIKASTRASENMQKLQEMTSRAFVFPTEFKLVNIEGGAAKEIGTQLTMGPAGPVQKIVGLDRKLPIGVVTLVRNKGPTPALEVKMKAFLQALDWDDPAAIHSVMPGSKEGATYLASGEGARLGGGVENSLTLTPQQWEDVMNKRIKIRFTIGITYNDIAGKVRTTSFAVFLNPKNMDSHPSFTFEKQGIRIE